MEKNPHFYHSARDVELMSFKEVLARNNQLFVNYNNFAVDVMTNPWAGLVSLINANFVFLRNFIPGLVLRPYTFYFSEGETK